jgi:hypothetical protein
LTEVARALGDLGGEPERVVREGFARRHLRVERQPERVPRSVGTTDAPLVHDGVRAREELTWIAIRLAYDDDPTSGVGHARYEVTLPDGTVRPGRLDRDGNARLDNIPPGTCEVVFPDFDKRKGSPPARVPPGKGHTPRRRKTDASPAAPPAVSNTQGPTTCHGASIAFESTTGRKGIERRVQVVAIPDRRSVHELSVPFSLAGAKKLEENIGRFSTIARSFIAEGLDIALFAAAVLDGVDDQKKARAKRDGATTKGAPAVSKKMLYDHLHGGLAPVTLRPTVEGACARGHARVVVDGEAPLPVDGAGIAIAQLPWRGGGQTDERATPTRYAARAQGCAGRSDPLAIEVFPGDQLLLALSLDLKLELTSGWFRALKSLLDDWLQCKLEGSVALEGKLEYLRGWREDRDWRVFFAEEFHCRPSGKFEARAQVSLLSLATGGLPASFLKYAADIGVFLEVTIPLTLKVDLASKQFPGDAARSARKFKGGIELAPKAAAGLYAQVGSKEVLGVAVSGSGNVDGKIGGPVEQAAHAVTFTPEAEFAPVRVQVKLLVRALVWKSEWSWDFPVTRPHKTRAETPWKLFEFNR